MSRSAYRRFSAVLFTLFFLLNMLPLIAHSSTTPAPAKGTAPRAEAGGAAPAAAAADAEARAAAAYAKLPVRFEANRGQTDARVRFVSRVDGYTLFLTPAEAVWSLGGETAAGRGHKGAAGGKATLRMRLAGADTAPAVEGLDPLPGGSNYLIGRDASRWVSDVPAFGKVLYKAVYPGIDVVYYGTDGRLEYDFRVAPGADPRAIRLAFEGARSMRVEAATGDLVLRVGGRELRQHAPLVYQQTEGARRVVASRYRLGRGGEVGFELGRYDARLPLVIDPAVSLAYGAFVGGGSFDTARDMALAPDGSVWIAGVTGSLDFPATAGAAQPANADNGVFHDAFVAKLSPAGDALLYATYLGGGQGDEASGVALDSAGNVYLTGYAASTDFPTTPGAFQTASNGIQEAFVVKLDTSAGAPALAYSTYLGGGYQDFGHGIAVDGAGRVHLAGSTNSVAFPTRNAFDPTYSANQNNSGSDAFVATIDPAGNGAADLVYSTYLGGAPQDYAVAVAVDGSGHTYVAGYTSTNEFPTTPGAYDTTRGDPTQGVASDSFVMKFDTSAAGAASLLYSTYLGGTHAGDVAYGVAVGPTGDIYLTGRTDAADFPITCTGVPSRNQGGPFITRIDPSTPGAEGLVYSSFFSGTTGVDTAFDIAVDAAGNCTNAGPVGGNGVDKKGPTIVIRSPGAQGYPSGSSVTADFDCADGGSGVATCTGTVADGSPVNTSGFGAKTFTVTATDKVGNTSTQTVTYSVSYNTCLEYDPRAVYHAGSTIPVKLRVCDEFGNNLSSESLVVTAAGVGLVSTTVYGEVNASGNANPDGNFRFVGGFYIFNMSTKGLGTGSYNLYYRVGDDPTLHTAPFNLK